MELGTVRIGPAAALLFAAAGCVYVLYNSDAFPHATVQSPEQVVDRGGGGAHPAVTLLPDARGSRATAGTAMAMVGDALTPDCVMRHRHDALERPEANVGDARGGFRVGTERR